MRGIAEWLASIGLVEYANSSPRTLLTYRSFAI